MKLIYKIQNIHVNESETARNYFREVENTTKQKE